MKKKLIIVLLSLVCALCLAFGLAACNKGTSGGTTGGGQNTEQSGDTEQGDTDQGGNISDDDADTETHIHNYTYEVTREATCTESGILTYTCIICGDYFTVSEDPLEHTPVESTENEVAATCTEDGSYDSVVYCSVCGDELSRETVIVFELGHNYSGYSYDDSMHWLQCTRCGEVISSESHTLIDYVCSICGYSLTETYSITLTNIGGIPLSGVEVDLRSLSGKKVGSGTTDADGVVRFFGLSSGTYTAFIYEDTLPDGYSLDDSQVTLTADQRDKTIIANSSVINNEEVSSGKVYSVGDVVYDFVITCYNTDGSAYNVTLSDYLKVYDVVIISFFYVNNVPSMAQTPYMQEAYNLYSCEVGIIAFDYTGLGDTISKMIEFKSNYGLTYDITLDTTSYYSYFDITSFPTMAIIDRYGIIAEIITEPITSVTSWINIFEYYLSEDYMPDYNITSE